MDIEDRFSAAVIRVSSPSVPASELAALLHIQPTRLVEQPKSSGAEARWFFESKLPESASIEEHIEDLLSLIEKHKAEFESLPPDCETDIWCTISSSSEFAGFVLSKKLIQRANRLGISFVFSVYNQGE